MPVYVDNYQAEFGNMLMSHLIADTHEELIAMVDAIGVKRKWIQCEGTPKEHFDICKSKRLKAIKYGAIELSSQALAMKVRERKIALLTPQQHAEILRDLREYDKRNPGKTAEEA